jgi:hypothetical protein
MACEAIQEKLVAAEALTEAERAHLEACADCRAMAATLEGLAASGAGLARFGQASQAEVAEVRAAVEAKLQPTPVRRKLAFALPALGLGVVGVVAMLTFGGGSNAGRTGEAVFDLMDEVDGYATAEQRVAVLIAPEQEPVQADVDTASDTAAQELSLLDEVDDIVAEDDLGDDEEVGLLADLFGSATVADEDAWELDLPGGYQVLDDLLEEEWL